MPLMAMQTGCWISNPLPNEQNADAKADARARKHEFCECGRQVGCSLERPTAQVEIFQKILSPRSMKLCLFEIVQDSLKIEQNTGICYHFPKFQAFERTKEAVLTTKLQPETIYFAALYHFSVQEILTNLCNTVPKGSNPLA